MGETYHRGNSRFLGKAGCVIGDHRHSEREISRERNDEAISHKARPNVVGINLPDHDGANQSHGSVECHPVSTSICQISASKGGYHDENHLESSSNHLHKKGIEGGEPKALHDNRGKLFKRKKSDEALKLT